MLRHRHMAVGFAALLFAGCGQFQLDRLRLAIVTGHVVGVDPNYNEPLALIQERTTVQTRLAADGRFELRDVPAGTTHLYVVASSEASAIRDVHTRGGDVLDLGDIEALPATSLKVILVIAGGYSAWNGTVTVRGTPFEQLPIGDDGEALIKPLVPACYSIEISIPVFGFQAIQTCVVLGQSNQVTVVFGDPGDAGVPAADCRSTAIRCAGDLVCLDGVCVECVQHSDCRRAPQLACTDDNRCVECTENSHCLSPPNLTCSNANLCVECARDEDCPFAGLVCNLQVSECEGSLPTCSRCSADDHCASGKCEELAGQPGVMVCLAQCGSGNACEQGFRCSSGRCVPDGTVACPLP